MAVTPRTPVIVGVGQVTARDGGAPTSARRLMARAAELALTDTGADAALRRRVDAVAVTACLSWPTRDPGRSLARALGVDPAVTVATRTGGTSPLDLLRDAATHIARGDLDVVLVAGGEAVRAMSQGRLETPEADADPAPTRLLGSDRHPGHPAEERAGMFQPLHYYPLAECAVRAAAGTTQGAHQAWLADLWGRFALAAKENPHAWTTPDPDAVAVVGPANRMVAHPYPKLLTANLGVDQTGAFVVCSAQAARDAGVPRDRWVFPAATSATNDHWFFAEREHLHRSPALAAAGRAAMGHAGVAMDDVTALDLYSCFPSAVQVAATELGVDLRERTPTVTGGLTFGGGPGSAYAMTSVAAVVRRLREDGDSRGVGLATAMGWYLTKHAVAVLSCAPPRRPYADLDVQAAVDQLPRRRVELAASGRDGARLESWTLTYDRAGTPDTALVTALLPGGARAVGSSRDADAVAALLHNDPLGALVHLDGTGRFTW